MKPNPLTKEPKNIHGLEDEKGSIERDVVKYSFGGFIIRVFISSCLMCLAVDYVFNVHLRQSLSTDPTVGTIAAFVAINCIFGALSYRLNFVGRSLMIAIFIIAIIIAGANYSTHPGTDPNDEKWIRRLHHQRINNP